MESLYVFITKLGSNAYPQFQENQILQLLQEACLYLANEQSLVTSLPVLHISF